MKSLGGSIEGFLGNKIPQHASALKIRQNNQRFSEAIRDTWADMPESADYILAHINSLYIGPDKQPRKGQQSEQTPMVLGVYIDDPLARTELQARKETFTHWARRHGLSFESLILHSSYGGMRERTAFPEAKERLKELFNPCERPTKQNPTTEDNSNNISFMLEEDQAKLMEDFRRSIALTFETLSQGKGFLDYLEGLYFYPEKTFVKETKNKKGSVRRTYYRCYCFVRPCDKELFQEVLDLYYPTIISKAALFDLFINKITCHASPVAVAGRCAFPTGSAPQPLPNFTKQELAELI